LNTVEEKTVDYYKQRIIDLIKDKKGEDITVIGLRDVTGIADYFIITTGTSSTHVKAIADEVRFKMKNEESFLPWHVEGYNALKWVLVDFVDIVVHIQDNHTREHYDLERLWHDAIITRIETDD